MAAAGIVGGLLPDIDHPNSIIRRKLSLLGAPFALIRHRTITHSALCLALLGVIAYLAFIRWPLAAPVLAAAIAGYAAHILADALTVEGVPLLWPVRWRLRGFFRTGGLADHALELCALLYSAYALLSSILPSLALWR